jgi:ABC-type sugar transport system ATPase subunit
MTQLADQPLLTVRGLSKSFPGQRALSDVSLEIGAGEIVAVVGQNGSGKSTLVKVLTGIYEPDPGCHIAVRTADGQQITGNAAHAEIHVIHQDLGLIPMLSTVENLGLGRSSQRGAFMPNRTRVERQHAKQLIARFGGDFNVRAPIETLRPAERTIVAIARALDSWQHPQQLLLLDEPTAALHGSEVKRLFEAVRRVANEGAGVVFISHRLDEVLGLADRVIALRGGRIVADIPAAGLDRARLIELIAGRAVTEGTDLSGRRSGATVLSLRDVSAAGINDVSLDLHAGEVLGVCGILGSGREHLSGVIFGAHRRCAGEVRVGADPLRSGSPHHSIARGIGFVSSDRHVDGAVMTLSARENLTLPGLRPLRGKLGNLSARAERRVAAQWAARVELDPPLPERELALFSGGNQQKVVLAKWLRNKPRVLLLDEPTQGVDVGAKAAIYQLISDAAADGAGVLVSSSDTAELAAICDKVLVFRDGAIATRLDRSEITEARLVAESLSAQPSEPALARGLAPTSIERGARDVC